jgi:ADP-dependent NAD(P)H-hydrate dehydratase / NAD(P)H-hydrate epimerase
VRLASVAESQRLDSITQTEFGVPGEILMEAAGALAAREIEQCFLPELERPRSVVLIFCGPGNNGGDGLVVARHLASSGHRVRVVVPENGKSDLFKAQLARLAKAEKKQVAGQASRITIYKTPKESLRNIDMANVSLIVDAIFGIGLKGEIKEPYSDWVEFVNRESRKSRCPVVSLDTPSGLDCDRGVIYGAAHGATHGFGSVVHASMTLTFGLAKPGFFISDGPGVVGRLKVLPIGFPREAQKDCARSTFAFAQKQAEKLLPKWSNTSNKSNHGHALIFAGSRGMMGAGILAATAAYRSGAGYVTLSTSDRSANLNDHPEFLTAELNDDNLFDKLFAPSARWTAAAIGPGLGVNDQTQMLLERLAQSSHQAYDRAHDQAKRGVVVDADAITVIAKNSIKQLPANWILTPHAGELARVLSVPAQEIEADRFYFARKAAAELGCVVLLKGYRTVVARPDGRATVVLAGNAALAKAGTGDVLTGLCVGFLAQGLSADHAALLAAYCHGKIADQWLRSGNSKAALISSDLLQALPTFLAQLRPISRISV